jgi:AcrR family transcriptional regulator
MSGVFIESAAHGTLNTAFSQMVSTKRTYELKERAQKQAETRRRIVEATVALHQEVGPARTTVAEVARRAGVQRLTVYNHFPDERELFGACSAHFIAENPPPDPRPWAQIEDPLERLRTALRETHAWFRRTRAMLANIERDVALLPALNEVVTAGRAPRDAAVREVLSSGWGARGARRRRLVAAIGLATSFGAWDSLVTREALDDEEAVEVLARAVESAAR